MTTKAYDGFFVGYVTGVPRGARGPIFLAAFLFLVSMALAAFVISVTQADPGPGRFDFTYRSFTGILETAPYPLVRIAPNETYPAGHTLLLSGQGKRGVQARATALDGTVVDVGGVLLKRGDIDMLQVGGRVGLRTSVDGLSADRYSQIVQTIVDLGTWRLTGEICDGKCYTGAMRPGNGIAHKACANLCLTGGIPPVFVSTHPVEGSEFLLLADQQGGPLGDEVNSWVAARVQIDGQIVRKGDLLVFKVDLATAKVVQ